MSNGTIVVLTVIVVIVLILIVRGATNSQKRNQVTPTPVQPEEPTSDSFYMEDSYAYNVVNLSSKRDLVVIHFEDSHVKRLTLPSSTIEPAHLYLDDVDLGNVLTSVPSNLGSVEIYDTDQIAWSTVWPQITSSSYLRRIEVGSISGPPDLPLVAIGDINFAGYDVELCNVGLDMGSVNNVSSIGNITMPANTTNPDCDENIRIVYCQELTSIGDIKSTNSVGSLQVDLYQNVALQSVGSIEIDEISYIGVVNNSSLTTIGRITTSRFSSGLSVFMYSNAFSGPMLSQILEDLDSTGFLSVYIDISGNPGSLFGLLTGSGQAAFLSLQGKGCTIVI